MEKFTPKTKMSLRKAELLFEGNGGQFPDGFDSKITAFNEEQRKAFKQAVMDLYSARNFLDDFSKKERFLVDTFRVGYIGKEIYDDVGNTYIQTSRGRPFGYIAAVYDEKTKKIYAGFTYVSKDEEFPHRVIGQSIALQRAIANREKGVDIEVELSSPWLKGTDVPQFEHFKNRAYRYFRPDEFSHSRGKTPADLPNFYDVHVWQHLVAAKNAKSKKEFKEAMKLLEAALKEVNPKAAK